MGVTEVRVARAAGPVSVRVDEARGPHAVVCLVWRFEGADRREALVGEISREVADLPLGAPDAVDGKGFLVDGFVVPGPCGRSGPYQVVVTVLQGGRELHRAVPPDHGTGTIGSAEVHFRYPFVLRVEGDDGSRGTQGGGGDESPSRVPDPPASQRTDAFAAGDHARATGSRHVRPSARAPPVRGPMERFPHVGEDAGHPAVAPRSSRRPASFLDGTHFGRFRCHPTTSSPNPAPRRPPLTTTARRR